MAQTNNSTNTFFLPNFPNRELNQPAQPCAFVTLANNILNVTGDGTVYDVLFDTIQFDQGLNVTLNNGGFTTFTAPVDGRYFVQGMMNLAGYGAGDSIVVEIIAGPLDIRVTEALIGNNLPLATAGYGGSVICSLTAGQNINIQVRVSNGAKTVDLRGSTALGGVIANYFSVSLLC